MAVATRTRAYGYSDTRDPRPFDREVWGKIATARRTAFGVSIVVAVLLHLPLQPFFPWLRILCERWFPVAALPDVPGETVIPVDLDLLPENEKAVTHRVPPTPLSDAPVSEKPAVPKPPETKREEPTKEPPQKEAPKEPPAPRRNESKATPGKLADPLSGNDGPSKLAKSSVEHPNVQVLIHADQIRTHALGGDAARLLTLIPEWRSFLGGTGIDPVRDLDHLLIAGPQFRDSSHVVVVAGYIGPEERVREALNVLVERTNGEWIQDAPVPAARAKADRASRIFALVPNRNLLVILPADAAEDLAKLNELRPFSKTGGPAVVIAITKTPANALRHVVKLPSTLKWIRFSLTPTSDGGADLAVQAADKDAETARRDAEQITDLIETMRRIDIPLLGAVEIIDRTRLVAEKDIISASTHLSSRQLRRILTFVETWLSSMEPAQR